MDVREKGKRFERYIVSLFKSLGFKRASTTRASNRLLDACKVDIDRIPYYIQCKNGYNRGLNYSKVIQDMRDSLIAEYDTIEYPLVILHKKSHRYEDNLAIIPMEDFFKLLDKIHNARINIQTETRS